MDEFERDNIEHLLDNVKFLILENKDFLNYSTSETKYATLDKISLKSDDVVTVFFKNDVDYLEFEFDDFEYNGSFVKFYNKNGTKLSLKIK